MWCSPSGRRDPRSTSPDAAGELAQAARGCTVCAPNLPLGPRPIFRVSATATILIASQAPGSAAHATGIPFEDASGRRLRDWLGLDHATFHDAARVAIVPMGFCYPGRLPNGGDAPPRPECAPLWRARFLAALPALRLTLLVGGYAQRWTLGPGTVTARVREHARFGPDRFPLPHPSWRTEIWARRHPWFAAETLPALREAVGRALT